MLYMAKKALSGAGGIGGLIAAKARRCGGSESICVADIFYGVEYAIVLTEDTGLSAKSRCTRSSPSPDDAAVPRKRMI